MPSLWKIFLTIIGIALAIWLIFWVLPAFLAYYFGKAIPSVGDVSGLLATLGGIMGAIFTVGGLVVALVAVLTQIQLQDRVNQEVSKAKQAVEDKFNNELRAEYEKRIQEQVEGILAASQASQAADWKQAEELTRIALQKHPKLQGARSALGFRLSNEVQEYFFRQLHTGLSQPLQRYMYTVDVASNYSTSVYPPSSSSVRPSCPNLRLFNGWKRH
jgi:hypothetical protein